MKLSGRQRHYQSTFDKIRRHVPYGKSPIYVKLQKASTQYFPDTRTKQYAKYLGVQILLATSYEDQGKTKYSLRTKAPHVIDVICTINNIPCLIVFVNQELHAIHMGYNPITDTFDDHVVLPDVIVPSSSVRGTQTQQGLEYKFRLVSHPQPNEQELDNELNNIVQEYNIQEQEIPEELQFQLDTITPNTQYYIPVYQRAIQIQRKIQSLKEQGKKLTVLHTLRYAIGL